MRTVFCVLAALMVLSTQPVAAKEPGSAIPQADPGQRTHRLRLSGEPRSPIDPDPRVCRFYGRCPKGQPHCASEMPVLREVAPSRQVACHFA